MDSPAAPIHMVVWRSTTMDIGELCVMTTGLLQTLMWLAVSLDLLVPTQVGPQVVLQGEVILYIALTFLEAHILKLNNEVVKSLITEVIRVKISMTVDFLVQLLNWVTIQLQLLFTQFVRKISLCEQAFMGEKAAIRIKFAV